MPVIQLTTIINAPIERCFDLSRSIDLHEKTTAETNEKAIAGVTSGLVVKGDQITWRAKHFGIYQALTSLISEMDAPYFFEDRMLKGTFKSIRHEHWFEWLNGQTVMKDRFEFESPFGFAGKLFNKLVLTKYLEGFLLKRNEELKRVAESEEWRLYLEGR